MPREEERRINKVRCKMTLFRDETRGKREDDTTWYDMTKTMTMTKALTMRMALTMTIT